MGRSLTNAFGLAYAIEDTIGDVGANVWKLLEPNAITTFGAVTVKVPRNPISKNRQRRKGSTTDLDSAVEFDSDITLDVFEDFIEGFVGANLQTIFASLPTATTLTEYAIPAVVTPLLANTLVYAQGFTNAANNGKKLVGVGSTITSVVVDGGGLVAETPPPEQNASLQITGFRFSSGDLEVDADGNLITTTQDLTLLGFYPGMMMWVGGPATINQFGTAEDKGLVRIVTIETNKLTIDNKSQDFAADTGLAKEIELYYGSFVKNVPVDDVNFIERSFMFEGSYENLANDPAGDEYEYPQGNYCNLATFELPLTDKATVSWGFVGTDTPVASTVRKSGADAPYVPVGTAAFNTSADIMRLRIKDTDDNGLTTDFKSVSLAINNNNSPEKVLGLLGAKYMNYGNFDIDLESQLLFTDSRVTAAIRNNDTITMDFAIRNDDGAIIVDVPAATMDGGDREFPVDESILVNTTVMAFGDPVYNASLMVSIIPACPNF